MFAQNFESESPPYALPHEPPGPYNGYLITPPRIYGESISGITAFYANKEQTENGNITLNAYVTCDVTYFPSYNFVRFRFDGVSGVYLDRADVAIGSAFDKEVYQSRDGSLWRKDVLGPVFEIDPLTFEEIPDTRQDPAKYGTTSLDLPMVERAQNLIVMQTGHEDLNEIGVYDFTSGELVRQITVSGEPREILPEDERRCYVTTVDNMLNLVDYSTGAILSTLRMPAPGDDALNVRHAWDRSLRRLLRFTHRADATDGACLSTISGWYPVPLGVGLTAPIPLIAPRAGRRTPFLCKVYGDAGEGVTGVKITPTVDDAALIGTPPFTDSDGEALVILTPDAAGTDTLEVSAQV